MNFHVSCFAPLENDKGLNLTENGFFWDCYSCDFFFFLLQYNV